MKVILQMRYLDLEKRYEFEFYHMGGVIHNTGMHRLWSSYAQPTSKGKPEPSAWLGQQRKNVSLCPHYPADLMLRIVHLCHSLDASYSGSIKAVRRCTLFHFPTLSLVHGDIVYTYPSDNDDHYAITVRCMI